MKSTAAVFGRVSLTVWILLAAALGILVGILWPRQAEQLQFVFNIFLRLIKCVVVPMVLGTLISGIASHADDFKAIGRLAFRSVFYFEVVTTLALLIGLAGANVFQPGAGIQLKMGTEQPSVTLPKITLAGALEHAAPQSFFDAAARNDLLQVAVFAILVGTAMVRMKETHRRTLLGFCDALSEAMFKLTGIIMWLAPLAVGSGLAWTIGKNGLGTFLGLGKLILTLYLALGVLVIFVFIPILWISKIPVGAFFRAVRGPALLAFSTASSEAALPDALEKMQRFGVPKRIASFVMTTGYSFNLDGTTLYLSVAVLFVAQAADIDLAWSQQVPILLTLMLASKGAAGVPRAALAILAGTLATFGLPAEGLAIIVGVDAFLDMGRTAINLTGNCLATAVVARWEGELKPATSLPVSDGARLDGDQISS